MSCPDLTGLDEEYSDRWPSRGWWLAVVVAVGYCAVILGDAFTHGHPWTAAVCALFVAAVGLEWVLRWRRPAGVSITTRGISVRLRSTLLRPGRWCRHDWDEVVSVEVELRRAFPSRLVLRSAPPVVLPGMPISAALALERTLENRAGRVRLRRPD